MLISIGKVSWKLVFPIIYSISVFCRRFSTNFPPKSPLLTLLLIIVSQLLIGILELISIFRLHTKKSISNNKTIEIQNEFSFIKHKRELNLINIILPFFLGFFNLYLVHILMIRDVLYIKAFTFER